ncbi:ABC transporter permease [Vibrio metschnikovii]|nr:ABC transporter permease [Vibrio metschnikovii]
MLPIRQIIQEMLAEKQRLLLTVLAVAWGTLCISMMLASGEGLRQGLSRASQSGNGQLIYITPGYASINSGRFFTGQALSLQAQDVDVVRALPSAQQAEISAVWDKTVRYQENSSWQTPYAVSPDYAQLTGIEMMPGGRWFNQLDNQQQRKVIVLGYTTASQLFNQESDEDFLQSPVLTINPVGKIIKVGDEDFTVIGVIKSNASLIEQGLPIDYALFVPLSTWQRFHPNQPIAAINVKPIAQADREQLAQVIKQVLARKYSADPSDEQLIQSQDMLLRQKSMQRFLLGLQSFLGVIGLVTLSVAGIGIANVMYATVKRATRDIGVRMAVGATSANIRLHYLVQSILTMGMGGIVGLSFTYGLIRLVQHLPLQGNFLYEQLGKPQPELSWPILFLVMTALVIIGVVAAWFPANRAANITPLEALQSE